MPTKKPVKKTEAKKTVAIIERPEPTEQEIIEVSQDVLKKGLKELMTNNESKRSELLEELYEKHAEYNKQYFFGELSFPLITFEKLDNRTLGDYNHGENNMGIKNHIRFNINFIALNPMERVLETLRHEMIHQWQDEVLYYKSGKPKDIVIKMINEKGKEVQVSMKQKKFPADRHNKDFKEMAKVVGIPAEGDKCYGNPANMPEPKSYNRKYQCNCIASNGYHVSIWSTRPIHGKCLRCGAQYHEVAKDGGTIKVKRSHVELPGQNAIAEEMIRKGYTHFEQFKSRKEFLAWLEEAEEELKFRESERGVYETHHNAHKEGYTHWIAYTPVQKAEAPSEEPKKKVDKKPVKKDTKKKTEPTKKPEPVVEEPPVEEPKPKKPAKKKKELLKVEEPVVEAPAVEPEKEQEDMGVVLEFKPKEEPKAERDYKNPQDLLDLYKELGSVKAVAEYFGMTSANVIYHAKKGNVNFKKGVIEDGSK